jgi:hypothetical protein
MPFLCTTPQVSHERSPGEPTGYTQCEAPDVGDTGGFLHVARGVRGVGGVRHDPLGSRSGRHNDTFGKLRLALFFFGSVTAQPVLWAPKFSDNSAPCEIAAIAGSNWVATASLAAGSPMGQPSR